MRSRKRTADDLRSNQTDPRYVPRISIVVGSPVLSLSPRVIVVVSPQNKLRAWLFDLIALRKFEIFIMSVIMINMVTMMMEHHNQSAVFSAALNILSKSCCCCCCCCCYSYLPSSVVLVLVVVGLCNTCWRLTKIPVEAADRQTDRQTDR